MATPTVEEGVLGLWGSIAFSSCPMISTASTTSRISQVIGWDVVLKGPMFGIQFKGVPDYLPEGFTRIDSLHLRKNKRKLGYRVLRS